MAAVISLTERMNLFLSEMELSKREAMGLSEESKVSHSDCIWEKAWVTFYIFPRKRKYVTYTIE